MSERIDYARVAPAALRAFYGLEQYIRQSELEKPLLELIKMRASQINGCAYCLDMHSKDARAHGETEQRLYVLNAWREAPFYSPRERAALAWTEAVTLIGEHGAWEEHREEVLEHFSEKELVDLTMAIVTINGWNRLAISLGADVGSYQPKAAPAEPSREPATVA